jgi:hypothetical protein
VLVGCDLQTDTIRGYALAKGIVEMGNQELKRSLESMQHLQDELSGSKEKTLEFLVEAGILKADGELARPHMQAE